MSYMHIAHSMLVAEEVKDLKSQRSVNHLPTCLLSLSQDSKAFFKLQMKSLQ